MAETDPLVGTVLDEKFRVERVLGMGGMGAVYEITHLITQHRRAMKLLHANVASRKAVVDRFLREASAAGRIGNPHIVETFDGGWLSTGEPYLVMEMLEGHTLSDRLAEVEGVGLPIAEVMTIFEQLADGVEAAHAARIIHRDLKPENVFISEGVDGRPFVRVLDFGISKFDTAFNTKLTAGGAMMGTPAYMSPEQFEDTGSVDRTTDVYALGVILHEALTGTHPYPATTLAGLMKKLMDRQSVMVSEELGLPAAIDDLLNAAMATSPGDRPQTVAELLTRFRAALELPALRAQPVTRPLGGAATELVDALDVKVASSAKDDNASGAGSASARVAGSAERGVGSELGSGSPSSAGSPSAGSASAGSPSAGSPSARSASAAGAASSELGTLEATVAMADPARDGAVRERAVIDETQRSETPRDKPSSPRSTVKQEPHSEGAELEAPHARGRGMQAALGVLVAGAAIAMLLWSRADDGATPTPAPSAPRPAGNAAPVASRADEVFPAPLASGASSGAASATQPISSAPQPASSPVAMPRPSQPVPAAPAPTRAGKDDFDG